MALERLSAHSACPTRLDGPFAEAQQSAQSDTLDISCINIVRRTQKNALKGVKSLLAHGDDWRCELPEWARQGCEFERGFVGSQPVGVAGGLRRLDCGLKGFAQRFGRHEQASGEFVGLPFHPAVFDFGDGGDVIEPFCGSGVL